MLRLFLGTFAFMLLVGCGHGKVHAGIPTSNKTKTAKVSNADLEGIASYYAEPYNGRRTANGEIFDSYNAMTAAHKTLPFNTVVRVKNLNNGEEVDVRINDRGPFVKGRVIDLSKLAAQQIDLVRAGIAPVKLKILKDGSPTTTVSKTEPAPAVVTAAPPQTPTVASLPAYGVQVGAFQNEAAANALRNDLAARYSDVSIQVVVADRTLYRVRVGSVPDEAAAEQIAAKLREEKLNTFVVRLN